MSLWLLLFSFFLPPVYGEISLKLLVLPSTNLVASWDKCHHKPFQPCFYQMPQHRMEAIIFQSPAE